MIVVAIGYLRVRDALSRAAAMSEPEVYVHDPTFQLASFLIIYGLPLLLLLALMLYIAKKASRGGIGSETALSD